MVLSVEPRWPHITSHVVKEKLSDLITKDPTCGRNANGLVELSNSEQKSASLSSIFTGTVDALDDGMTWSSETLGDSYGEDEGHLNVDPDPDSALEEDLVSVNYSIRRIHSHISDRFIIQVEKEDLIKAVDSIDADLIADLANLW